MVVENVMLGLSSSEESQNNVLMPVSSQKIKKCWRAAQHQSIKAFARIPGCKPAPKDCRVDDAGECLKVFTDANACAMF